MNEHITFTKGNIPVTILTVNSHGQIFIYSTPILLILGVIFVLFGVLLIWLWAPKY